MQTHSPSSALPAPFDQPVNTSGQAFAALRPPDIKHKLDRICDICLAAQRNGYDDLTRKEIQARYEMLYGCRIDASSVSSSVNNLIIGKRLERAPVRCCTVTGNEVEPVRVPYTQARLVG